MLSLSFLSEYSFIYFSLLIHYFSLRSNPSFLLLPYYFFLSLSVVILSLFFLLSFPFLFPFTFYFPFLSFLSLFFLLFLSFFPFTFLFPFLFFYFPFLSFLSLSFLYPWVSSLLSICLRHSSRLLPPSPPQAYGPTSPPPSQACGPTHPILPVFSLGP